MAALLRHRTPPVRTTTTPSTPFSSHRVSSSSDGSFPYANNLSMDAKSYRRYDSNEWGFGRRSKLNLWLKKIVFGVGLVLLAYPWVDSIKLFWRVRSLEKEITILQEIQLQVQDDIQKQMANFKKWKRDSEAQKMQNDNLLEQLKEKGESFDDFDSNFYVEVEGIEEKYFRRLDDLTTEVQMTSQRSLTQRGYDITESDPIRVVMTLEKEIGNAGKQIVMELGPMDQIPHAIDLFTLLIERKQYYDGLSLMFRSSENNVIQTVPMSQDSLYDKGISPGRTTVISTKPSRNPETLQKQDQILLQQLSMLKTDKQGMPIEKYSVFFADHGPHFYINMEENFIVNEVNEQETCFGKVVEGKEILDFILGYHNGKSRDIYYVGIESVKVLRPNSSRSAFGSRFPNDGSSINFQTKWTASIKVPPT